MVDGIRVYLPADNRLDIGFFPTATLSQIQVQKGYVSVLSGPGAIGGAHPNNPPLTPTFHLTGVPYSQLLVYVTFDVTPRFRVTPNLQLEHRWTNTTNGASYFKTGSFTLWNLEAELDITDRIGLQVGARNLLDQNYQLVGGFPSGGRSFFVNLRLQS